MTDTPALTPDAEARALHDAARAAMARAHAPYSNFPVGAAVLCDQGRIFAGCNVENASFPEGWCAETSAIAHMVAAGARRIVAIAVVAARRPQITPCGGCRQRIAEFGDRDTRIHLCGPDGVTETLTLAALLPRAFDSDAL